MLSGQPRRRHALENEPDVRSGKTSLARELPCEGEEALGLRRDGSRVVEKQERARTGESPEIGDRGKLVKKLGGILPEHDVDRLSVGDGALALRPDVVGTNHRPLPAEPGDLSTVEICEPKFLAVRGIRENRDTRTRGALEHVEPTPEQRVGQWPGGEELLRERELRAEFLERRGGPEKIAAQPPQETVEPGRERDERVRLGRAEPERAPGADCALAGPARQRPADEQAVGEAIRRRHPPRDTSTSVVAPSGSSSGFPTSSGSTADRPGAPSSRPHRQRPSRQA